MTAQTAEYVHIWLVVGQYVLFPFAFWAARKIKHEILDYIDARINGQIVDLSDRVTRLENAVLSSLERQRRVARDSRGRFSSSR